MGSKAFTDPDIRQRLLASATRLKAGEAPPYIAFFRSQPPVFSTERGYGRMLRSEYELRLVDLFIRDIKPESDFREVADLLRNLNQQAPAEHAASFTPLRQAVDVFTGYRQHGTALETLAHGSTLLHAELTVAAEVAATATAWAFRDLALHELYTLAGGNARASQHALMTGTSFAALRQQYRVKLSASTFELNDWRSGLMKTMQQLQASSKPTYASFADMRQQMLLKGRGVR